MNNKKDKTECSSCGTTIDTTKDTETHKEPCSNCGSTIRKYHPVIEDVVHFYDGWTVKGKRRGHKKPFVEDISKPDYSHIRQKLVHKSRLIDRDNDTYREEVKDYQTGEIIHFCEEPLSEHSGHGSAKSKKKKTTLFRQ
jgi:PHP family Zn ribbon phosphoesterase